MAIFVREEQGEYAEEMLDPRNDFVFKMLLGQKKNHDLLLGFLNAVLTVEISKVNYVNPYLELQSISDKASVMDIRVETTEGEQINLEIQLKYHKAFPERMLMYWARMYASQDESKKKYTKLKKSVQIVVTDFSYLPSDEFHSTFHIIEKDKLYAYTDHLEMHILELPKMNKQVEENPNVLEKWLLFLKGDHNTKEVLAMQEPTFQKAYDELNQMSHDKEMRARALSREFFLRDQMQYQDDAREEGLEEGMELGWKKGLGEGMELGGVRRDIETVKLLVKKGMSPSGISDLLEIPLSVVEDYLSK